MSRLHVITIVRNGMPFITWHLNNLERSGLDWVWHVVHGAADNVCCTAWCKKPEPGLSTDGTTEFLRELADHHPRVMLYERDIWPGKVTMFQAAIQNIKEPAVLVEADSDEIWTGDQFSRIVNTFERYPRLTCMRFHCRFMLGWNIRAVGGNCYGANPGEWLRAWAFKPGMQMKRHEPPFLSVANGDNEVCLGRDNTANEGLIFTHYAYVTEAQLRQKEAYYGYFGALNQWRLLQSNTVWPVKRLKDYLDWVDERAGADLLHK